ncbi:metal ABC transporter solute-binding protein, Zn/Mn family [Thermococcus waiotapuensis]|uniref:Zinc ABC transporter substrate-binding protein n=1 Tax=Thermococcus waiotapuensis TaxID=90909 RepID=A0AAE4SYC5_9EURY|nr:zinc ABC transporter substrate-binding protein [Thermococcus waiotapuensis]MDV3103584.1 zinc ABC transporter substrate-binding protein [Thermococcus waiotapuensis]
MKARALLLILLLAGMGIPFSGASNEKPLVVVSIGPIASIVSEAFGDAVDIATLIPLGADPHEYQLTAGQVELLKKADVIVTTGGHLPVEGKMADLKNEGVITGELLLIDDYKLEGFRYLPEWWYNNKDNPHGTWLDPDNAVAIASATEKALEKVDPTNAQEYRSKFEKFREKVEAIKYAYSGFVEKNMSAVIDTPPIQYAIEWLGIRAVASVEPEEEVPAQGVDQVLPRARESDVIVYSLQSPDQLKNVALELSEKSEKPVAGITVFWEGKPYTEVLRENAVSVLKASEKEIISINKSSGGFDLAYLLSALLAGLSLGAALGYILKS